LGIDSADAPAFDEFGYLSVILSIILGLSATQLLQGISQVINARDRVRIYWPAIGWTLLLLEEKNGVKSKLLTFARLTQLSVIS
jgi:hypothetical protein